MHLERKRRSFSKKEGRRSGNDHHTFHTRTTPNKFRKNLVLLISRKRSTTTLQRFADGLCSHEKSRARSTSFQVNPPPLLPPSPPSPSGKRNGRPRVFLAHGSLFSSAVWQPLPLHHHHPLHTYTHTSPLPHTRVSEEGLTFFATSQSQQSVEAVEEKGRFDLSPSIQEEEKGGGGGWMGGCLPFRRISCRERAGDATRILFSSIQRG